MLFCVIPWFSLGRGVVEFTRMFVAIVNRFTLILATAGLLVALFAISGNQSNTVSARTIVIPESSGTSTTATSEAPEVRIEYIGGRVRSITEGNSITPRVALTGDSIGGLEQDLVVNFAIKDGATASQSDYSYPSSVTIPAGTTSAQFTLSALADDLIEYNETFNIYISSLDYNGENYNTEHAGVEFTIKSPDRIWRTIEKLPSSSWIEGGTANIRVGLTKILPSDVPANSLFLTIGDGYDDIDITEQLKSSTEVDLSIPLNDNSLRATNEQLRIGLQFQKSQIPFLSKGGLVRINIADDEEPPQVVVRRNSRGRTSTISEGGRVQLTALAPGVAPVDLVVSLAAGMSTTLASSDYDFPASVTIPKGQRSVRFWVDTSDDEQAEYADILNIRPTSVVYGSHTHPLSDTGVDLTVNSSDRIGAAVDILGPDRLNEGDTVYIRITVDELLPPETPDGSIYLVLGRRNQASGNSILADQDDTAGLPVNIIAALKVATSTVVPVELTDDSLIELNERVFVTLAYDREQVPFFRGRISGRFIVLDNDQTSFSIAPLSRVVYRENEAIELTVELPDGVTSTLDIQIRYRIKLGLRDADGRRVNTVNRDDIAGFLTGTVIIPAGETSAMFRIELTEDQLVEETELLGIRLQRPRVIREDGRTRGLRNAVTSEITVVSVIDNDRPTIKIRSLRRTELVEVSGTSTSATVTEGDSIRLVAEITNAPNGAAAATALNLGANTAGTTAYADDYWFPATVTIPTGSVRAVFTVNTFDDDVAEGDETLNIYVAGVNYGDDSYSPPDSGFDLTIVDDDEPPVVVEPPVVAVRSLSGTEITEGNTAQLVVELTNAPEGGVAETITVHLETGSETTASETEYSYPSSVTIPPGQSEVRFLVSTTWYRDGLRSFRIYPSSVDYLGSNYEQSDSGATVIIRDIIRDYDKWYVNIRTVQDTPTIPIYASDVRRINEGESVRMKVVLQDKFDNVLGSGLEETVTVNLRLLYYGAEASASDYSFPRVITIPPGQSEMEFEVKTFLDDLVEDYEYIYIGIRDFEYGGRTYRTRPTIGLAVQIVVIDNNRYPVLEIMPVSSGTIDEGESVRLEVNVTNAPEGGADATITVHLATWRHTTMASESDYSYPSSVTIPRGQSRVEFEVSATEDSLVEDNETFQIYIAKVARGNRIFYGTTFPPASVTIVDDDTSTSPAAPLSDLTAQLNTSSLTLQEGRAATITVDLSGDLSSLIDGDTSVLTIEARPVEGEETGLIHGTSDIYLPADLNDYELTPVTIDKQAGQATFKIRAVEDSDYDPLESVMLELVSQSDDVEVVSPNSLKLKIENNDPRPFVSFSSTIGNQRLNWEYENVGVQVSSVLEGDKRDYRIVLDRKSNRDTEFVVYLGGGVGESSLLLREDGETPFPHSTYWSGPKYQDGEGYWSGSVREEWERVIIPAGELGLTFTVDTTSLENDLYDYYWDRALAVLFIYVYKEHYAYTDEIGSKHYFFLTQDEPAPQLLLKNSANDGDGDASITVSEGESFDVWVEVSHQFGTSVIFNEPGLNLGVPLTATTISGAVFNLELPAVHIGPYQSGVTVTVQIPDDSLVNGERTVALGLEDVGEIWRTTRGGVPILPLRVPNRLIVTILDAEPPVVVPPSQPPVVRVRAVSETVLVEGSSLLLAVELINAPEGGSAETITVQLNRARRLSHTLRGNRSLEYQSVFTIPRGQSRVEFEVTLRDDGIVNDSDVANIYVWSFYYGGEYYRQSDPGVDVTIVDYINAPAVTVLTRIDPLSSQRFSTVHEGLYSARLYVESYVPNQNPYYYDEYRSAGRDIVVHLATRDVTTSESDYSFPSSVTIPRGKKQVEFTVLALNDDLVEFDETFYIYATSVEYRGQTFKQFDPGVRLTIENHDDIIQTSINVSGGIEQLEGTTVTVQVELSEELPAGTPANSVKLAFTPRDNARTVGQLPYVVDITDDLRDSTIVAVPFFLGADYLQEQADLVNLSVVISDDELREVMPETQSYFRIVADYGQNYEQPDTDADLTIIDNENPPIVTIRQVWPGVLYEEEFEQPSNPRWSASELWHLATVFEAVLTNAPSGGTAETITVHLETGDSTTASWYDYSYPSSVTIPQGRSLGRFTIRARDDLPGYYQDEYRETLNVYVSSVDYLGQNYEQSDSGVDLNIIGDEKMRPSVTVLGGDNHPEGSTVTVNIRLRKVLPARIPTGSVKLAISLTGGTRSVAVDGQSHTFEGDEPFVIDITEDLKNSTQVALPLYLVDDDFPGQTGLMKIEWIIAREESIPFSPLQGNSFNPILLENPGPSTFRISDNDGPRVDNDLGPVVNLRTDFPKRPRYFSYGEGRIIQLVLELPNAPEGGATQDITVHLATKNGATASEADYSYPSSVTIPRGRSQVMFEVRLLEDDLPERAEQFEIYVSSVDYAGQNYKQSNAGITVSIYSYDDIRSSLTAEPGGIDQVKGRTITVRIELSHPLPPASYDRAIQLSFQLSGSTRFVDATVDGLPFILGLNRWWSILEVSTERFGDSTTLDIPFYLADDGLPEESDLELKIKLPLGFRPGYFNSRYPWEPYTKLSLRIIDNDDLPIVTVRTPQGTEVDEGDTVQLEIELTNAPDGGMAEDITVHLATGSGTTAPESDYSYPSSVTIPQGQSRVTFEISALQDDLVEDDETLNIYASSVDYNGHNYEQSDAGVDLTIVDDNEPPIVVVQRFWQIVLNEGETKKTHVTRLMAKLINAPEGGTVEDITVHLASGDSSTASESDYSYPRTVTIPQGESQANFWISPFLDGLAEYREILNIYVSSVDYLGQNYEQSDSGVDIDIISVKRAGDVYRPPDNIRPDITVLGGVDHQVGTTVTVRVEISEVLPARILADSVRLAASITGSATSNARSVSVVVDGQSVVLKDGEDLFDLDITEDLKNSTQVDIPIYLADDDLQGQTGLVHLKLLIAREERIPSPLGGHTDPILLAKPSPVFFRVIDDDEPPIVAIRSLRSDTSTPLSDLNSVDEGDTVQLVAELTNAPEGGAAQDITVNLATGNGATASASDYSYPSSVTIPQGQSRVIFEFSASQDDLVEDDETLNIYASSVDLAGHNYEQSDTGADLTIIDDDEPPVVVPPATEVTITATLERSLFTLNEGRVATIQIDLDGDLSSLVDGDTTTLAIKDSPVGYPEWGTVFGNGETTLPAERNDYELTPVTINKLTRQATFEVRAVDDSDFDPLENVKLEVVSLSDDVNIISTNSLKLTIGDNDPQPFVSFATTLPASRDADGQLNVRLFEGETGTFRVVLDRKSNRAVQIYVYSNEPSTPYDRFFDETGVNPIRHSSQHGNKYITDRGYRPGQYSTVGSRPILIPAGEWGLTFTADTRSFANDLYDYIESDYFGQVFLEVRQRKYAFEAYGYTDKASSRINFITVQDEPIPELSFQSDADGDATITAREGESFDVRIDIDPPPGEYFRASALNNALPGVSLVSQLAATAVIGEIPAWGLPDVKIVPGQSGVTATVWVPVDGLANGTRTVTLDFEDAMLHYTSGDRAIPARIKNSLIVTILDNDPTTPVTDEPPVVAVQFTDLIDFDGIDYEKYLYEGWERSLTVELIDAPPGGARQDITVHLATGSDSTVSESDYSYPSSVTIPRGRSSVEFTVRSIDDTQVEPRETLNIYASSVDYGGQSYEQSDPGVDLTIFNNDELGHPNIDVVGDVNQILGATVTLQVTLKEVLAENLPARSFMIGFSRNWAQAIDLTEDLKHSTTTYVSVNAKDHPALGKVGWVEFYYTTVIFDQGYIYGGGPSRQWLRWQGLINVIDPAELPIVTINSVRRTEPAEVISGNSLSEPPFSELRRPIPFNDLVTVREGDTVQLELELISVPEGSMADTMTVHLITKNITTSESDYRVPSIVTIPRGQSRVTFEVNALQDSLGEDDESLYIYARTVSFGGQSYRQLYSRPNLSIAVTIVDDEEQLPIALQYVNDQSVVFEGESALLEVVLPDLPEGGLVDTMTVRLATGNKTTASSSDYSYPSTVTIPRGESRATFVVRARQDSWRERDETLNIYVSQFDYRGENYERAGLGVDLTIANNSDVIPIVTIRPHHPAFDSVSEGGRNTLKLGVTNIPWPRGADRDITVYLKTRNITASDYDYTYQSVITIPRGQNYKWAYVRGVDDNLLENHEYFEIYVSSIDYGGQNYEQSDTGTRLELRSNNRVQESLKVLGGADQAKGTTVTVRLELNYPLPAGVPDNTVELAFFLTGSTRAVDATVYGQQFVLGLSERETYLTIPTEAFQDSTIVDIPFYLADDGLAAEPGLELRIRSIVDSWGLAQVSRNRANAFFRVIDNGNVQPPIVSIRSLRDTSTPLTSTSSVRRSNLNSVNEGDTVQLEIELTNAPEGGAAEDITVHLATENSSAVSRSDYSYPSSVTIPRGQSRVTFEVSALQDDLVEDDEILNIYVSSVDYGGQSYEQSDTGVDLTIVDVDNNEPPAVTIRSLRRTELVEVSGVEVLEGDTLTLEVELTNAPEGGTTEDITVNLASGSSSVASRDDYSYPSSVTIPQGQSFVRFDVQALNDDLLEYPEKLNIYVSSVDYAGRNYEQSRGGVDLTIISDDRIEPMITVLGGTDHLEGSTVTVRIAMNQVLPANVPIYEVTLLVWLNNRVRAVSQVSPTSIPVYGVTLSAWLSDSISTVGVGGPIILFLGDAFKASTSVDVVFSLTDDYIAAPDGKVNLRIDSYDSLLLSGARSRFNIIDNDEPLVTVRSDTSTSLSDLNEGDTVQLVAELTNAPEDGAPRDITVHLATQNGATASESDYSYPSSVTIPWGQSRVTFEVSALQDDLVEDDETLNIYVSSVDYNGYNYEQSDTGADLTIVDVDFNDPPIVSVRRHGANFGVGEGTSASLIAELIPAPQYGTDRDITVHLAIGSWSTASETDYSYPSSVTIPRGQSFVRFDVQALNDDLPEYPETLNVHVSSVDYAGRNYVQTRGGVDLKIISDDQIEPVITVLGGVDHPEGSTVTVRIAVSQVLPADIPVNAITLSVSLSDSIRSVSVDGRSLGSEQSRVLYLVNALKASTSVDVVFSLTDDYSAGPDGFVKLRIDSYDSLLLSGARSYFRIIDNDEPPVVVVPDPVVTIRSLSVAEGGVEVTLVGLVKAIRCNW